MKIFKPKFWDNNKTFILPILLLPVSIIIYLVGIFKNFFIKKRVFPICIICVGNIYLGGTGKTPFSIKLFSILKSLNKNPVFIRKKYNSFKDEVRLQKQIGPVYENKKRTEAINQAIQNKADIAILDDGFQDPTMYKNLSIVCFNEKQWVGNGFLIPSGPLRESLFALNRANYVVINGEKNENIEKEIFKKNNLIKIFYAKYQAENIDEFKDKKVVSFAGIGNPVNFFELLNKHNINILEKISFPDHYDYSTKDLEILIEKSKKNNAILLTTEKDYFRINEKYKINIKYLKIKVNMEKEKEFIEEIKKII